MELRASRWAVLVIGPAVCILHRMSKLMFYKVNPEPPSLHQGSPRPLPENREHTFHLFKPHPPQGCIYSIVTHTAQRCTMRRKTYLLWPVRGRSSFKIAMACSDSGTTCGSFIITSLCRYVPLCCIVNQTLSILPAVVLRDVQRRLKQDAGHTWLQKDPWKPSMARSNVVLIFKICDSMYYCESVYSINLLCFNLN